MLSTTRKEQVNLPWTVCADLPTFSVGIVRRTPSSLLEKRIAHSHCNDHRTDSKEYQPAFDFTKVITHQFVGFAFLIEIACITANIIRHIPSRHSHSIKISRWLKTMVMRGHVRFETLGDEQDERFNVIGHLTNSLHFQSTSNDEL